MADDIRSIFYASRREKALELAARFTEHWQKDVPSAVKCLKNSLDSCLTFFDFPEEEWISLRTTNVIERLNKEFKRRTKPMEIVAGENAGYTLLAFISIKMEIHWRSNPVGKVRYNLPSLRNLIEGNFTQSPRLYRILSHRASIRLRVIQQRLPKKQCSRHCLISRLFLPCLVCHLLVG